MGAHGEEQQKGVQEGGTQGFWLLSKERGRAGWTPNTTCGWRPGVNHQGWSRRQGAGDSRQGSREEVGETEEPGDSWYGAELGQDAGFQQDTH